MKHLPTLPKSYSYSGKNKDMILKFIENDLFDDAKNLLEQEVGEKIFCVHKKNNKILYELNADFDIYHQAFVKYRIEQLEEYLDDLGVLKDALLDDNDFARSCRVDDMTKDIVGELEACEKGYNAWLEWVERRTKCRQNLKNGGTPTRN